MNPVVANYLDASLVGLFVVAIFLVALPWISVEGKWRSLPIIFAISAALNYMFWRVTNTIPSPDEPISFIAGLLFFTVEFCTTVGTILSLVTLTRVKNRTEEVNQNLQALDGSKAPLVDVFICTYNEGRDVLEPTMVGAKGMDYDNFRVWVLDDGRRPWLADLAKELDCHYLTRPDNSHAKAGNINNALNHVWGLDEKSEFASILDADFVPTRDFLKRTVSLFSDKKVGIVQTPQHFINPDPIQMNLKSSEVWPDEQRYFFNVLMPSKDAWGTAFCCGTSSVLRMEALKAAGGFPTDSVTEDYLVTIRLKQLGYNTIYLNEPLSLGLAPEGIKEYITQRSRWCLGFMQIMRGKYGPLKLDNGLSLQDRISLFETFTHWGFTFLFRLACLLLPPLYLLFGIKTFDAPLGEAVSQFLPYYIINVTVMAWVSRRHVLPIMTDIAQVVAAKEIVRAGYTGLFRDREHKFVVTPKGGDRSKTIIHWDRISFLGLIAFLNVAGIFWAFFVDTARDSQSAEGVILFWCWYNIIVLVASAFVCVDKPRFRKSERMPANIDLMVSGPNESMKLRAIDVSTGGIMFRARTSLRKGDSVTIDIEGQPLKATVVRVTDDTFSVKMDRDTETQRAMIRFVYSGALKPTAPDVRTTLVAGRVIRRVVS